MHADGSIYSESTFTPQLVDAIRPMRALASSACCELDVRAFARRQHVDELHFNWDMSVRSALVGS